MMEGWRTIETKKPAVVFKPAAEKRKRERRTGSEKGINFKK
jgi:hypothetical protein